MTLLHYLSYAAIVAAFAFVTLSLASGLLYVSELIEEHSRTAKIVGQRGIYTIILLLILLYFSDSLPITHILFSVVCHVVYLQNFSSTWPIISLTSISFLASCVLVITDHFVWFFYFARVTQDARHSSHRTFTGVPGHDAPGFAEIATFFGICVWLVPLFLFLSLSANDNALPTSIAEPGVPASSSIHSTQPRGSLFKSVFSNVFDAVPRKVRPRLARRDTTEGIIAPRSPGGPMSPGLPPSPGIFRSATAPGSSLYSAQPPPRSPNPHANTTSVANHLSPNPNFRLGTPPIRSPQTVRRSTGESEGLGLRRSNSSSLND